MDDAPPHSNFNAEKQADKGTTLTCNSGLPSIHDNGNEGTGTIVIGESSQDVCAITIWLKMHKSTLLESDRTISLHMEHH